MMSLYAYLQSLNYSEARYARGIPGAVYFCKVLEGVNNWHVVLNQQDSPSHKYKHAVTFKMTIRTAYLLT